MCLSTPHPHLVLAKDYACLWKMYIFNMPYVLDENSPTFSKNPAGHTQWVNFQRKEETPIMAVFSPTTYAKEICFAKFIGEFSPTKYTMKVLL